jgi:L-fuconolactonase
MPYGIIDTHVHIWDFGQAEYDWLKGDTSILNRTYAIEEIETERIGAGITEGVLVQAANNAEDTDWMLKVAAKTNWITGVVGWLPLLHPEKTAKALTEKYLTNSYFKGVRHLIHNEPDPGWLLQDEILQSLQILADNRLPYDIVGIVPEHIKTALKVAEKVPHLKMVFDHLNQPPVASKEKFGVWGELMKEASGHSNFYIKISGLGTTSGNFEGWTTGDLKPYIEFALQHFGEDRCFCGSDWPVSLLAGSYTKTWQAYQTILESILNRQGQEKVFYKNAQNFYHL